MNRHLTYLIGPETVLTLFTVATYWFCSRHNSGAGRDVALMEKLVMLLPFIITPIVFATIFVPGAKTWWWLGRTIGETFVAMLICGGRLIEGFGTGAKGQDGAFLMIVMFGSVAVALATSVTGAMILAETRPAFANWFHAHKILGTFLTLLSAGPIGFALGITVTFVGGILLALYCEIFKR